MMKNNVLAKKILCGLLAAGVLGVAGSALAASYLDVKTEDKTIHDDYKIDFNDTSSGSALGIDARNGHKALIDGSKIDINVKGLNAGQSAWGVYTYATKGSTGGGNVILGKSDSVINININADMHAMGIQSAGNAKEIGSYVEVNGKELNIIAYSNKGFTYALNIANNSTPTSIEDGTRAKMVINAEKTYINASSDGQGACGIVVMSQGILEVNGDLEVVAEKAIVTRGNSNITINKDGNHVVKLNGDIDFNYDEATSKTTVDSSVDITLNGADSYLTGRVAVDGTPLPPVGKDKVNGMNMNISNGAAWNMTADSFVNTANVSDGGVINVQENVKNFKAGDITLKNGNLNIQGENSEGAAQNISITKLSNDAGAINMQGSAQNLEITDLSSNNGTINMYGNNQMIKVVNDFDSNGGTINMEGNGQDIIVFDNFASNDTTINLQGEDQNINLASMSGSGATVNTNSLDNGVNIGEKADGTKIAVHGSKAVTDQIASGQATLQQLANVVGKAETGSEISLADTVTSDANDIIGGYSAEVGKDGKVIASSQKTIENPTNRAISDMASISLMTWRQENNDMNKRLSELRDSKGEHGAWARMARGESKYGSQNVKNQYNYYQVGYDEKLSVDPNWTVGVALTRTEGNSTFATGSGENKHTGVAIYGSYLNDNGSFIDLIAKYARMDNEYKTIGAGVGDADYETNGYSLSAEYGKRFTKDNGFWIEPQVELTYGTVGSVNYTTSKGAKVYQESVDSLVARLGFALGKNIKQGNIYARASYLYDFDGETKATMMKAGAGSASFEQDLGGGWWEVGVGTNINLSDATHLYFDVEKTYGGNVATPWQWNAGVRWSF